MDFVKMHGLGNDFIFVDNRQNTLCDMSDTARRLCDRHTGIGADGLVLVCNSHCCDLRMRIFNADGSEAEMCGNATRCFAKYAYEHGLVKDKEFSVETMAGVMRPAVTVENGLVTAVRVDMGCPDFAPESIPAQSETEIIGRELDIAGKRYRMTSLLMGVPHTILYVDAMDIYEVEHTGPVAEHLPLFVRGTNVNFVHVLGRNDIELRTWERGCGRTLACGTGSCASAVACAVGGLTDRTVNVHLMLGTLKIEWNENGHVYMTGPATTVFEGTVD